MNRRYKILIPILLLLVALFFYLRRQAPVEQTFRLFHADSLQIARIEIRQSERYVLLEKQDGIWMMTHPQRWRAQMSLIDNLFRDLINNEISTTIISESTEHDRFYGLDSPDALVLKLYDSHGRILDNVRIGNAGNPFDYIRREGSNAIYQTRAKVANVFVPEPQHWRDPRLLDIAEHQILRIAVRYRKNSYTLAPDPPYWRYTDSRESFMIPLENTAIVRVLNVLNQLQTYTFYEGDNTQYLPLFEDPDCTVEVFLRDRTKRKLTFTRLSDTEFLLMLDDDSTVLYSVLFDTVNRFTRASEIFRMLYG